MDRSAIPMPFRSIRHASRLAVIVNTFAKHGLYSIFEHYELYRFLPAEEVRRAEEIAADAKREEQKAPTAHEPVPAARRIRRALEDLGPAFVKLGQLLAVREDMLPPDYIEELSKLHFQVESLPFEVMEQRLKEELGAEKLQEFSHIERRPLAAGSIAQVHAATLKSGEEVVIKIQRPAIEQQINTDLFLLESFAHLLEKLLPEAKNLRPQATLAALAQALRGELDFIREAGSMSKIAVNFRDQAHVKIPTVYWQLTTTRILTLQRLYGIPASDRDGMVKAGISPAVLVERGLAMFLKMVFVDGLFHGDLHPGNLLALQNNDIGVIDFGMSVRISRWTRENLAALLVALIREDYERMVQHFLELSDPSPHLNVALFTHEIANTVSPYVGLKLRQVRSAKVLWDLAKIAARHGTPFPQDLIVFVKTLASFEGIGLRLDPDFDVLSLCEGFAADLVTELYSTDSLKTQAITVARDFAGLARHAPPLLRKILSALIEGHIRINIGGDEIARLSRTLDRSSARLSVSVVIAALLVGSSILTLPSGANAQGHLTTLGIAGFVMAGMLGFYLVISLLRRRL